MRRAAHACTEPGSRAPSGAGVWQGQQVPCHARVVNANAHWRKPSNQIQSSEATLLAKAARIAQLDHVARSSISQA
jgi:hypothetical protein